MSFFFKINTSQILINILEKKKNKNKVRISAECQTQQENDCIIFSHYLPSPSSICHQRPLSFFTTHLQIVKLRITFWAKFTEFKMLPPTSQFLFYFFLLFRLVIQVDELLKDIIILKCNFTLWN